MENIILILIIVIVAVLTWLMAGLIDEVKELKMYNKHYKNMIRAYQEELKKKTYINEIKKSATAGTVTLKNLNK